MLEESFSTLFLCCGVLYFSPKSDFLVHSFQYLLFYSSSSLDNTLLELTALYSNTSLLKLLCSFCLLIGPLLIWKTDPGMSQKVPSWWDLLGKWLDCAFETEFNAEYFASRRKDCVWFYLECRQVPSGKAKWYMACNPEKHMQRIFQCRGRTHKVGYSTDALQCSGVLANVGFYGSA